MSSSLKYPDQHAIEQPPPSDPLNTVADNNPTVTGNVHNLDSLYSSFLYAVFQKTHVLENEREVVVESQTTLAIDNPSSELDQQQQTLDPPLTFGAVEPDVAVDQTVEKVKIASGLGSLFDKHIETIPSNLPIRGPTVPLSESAKWNPSFLENLKSWSLSL